MSEAPHFIKVLFNKQRRDGILPVPWTMAVRADTAEQKAILDTLEPLRRDDGLLHLRPLTWQIAAKNDGITTTFDHEPSQEELWAALKKMAEGRREVCKGARRQAIHAFIAALEDGRPVGEGGTMTITIADLWDTADLVLNGSVKRESDKADS